MHPVAALGLFATGAYLTQSWGWRTPWILCGIAGLIVVAAVGVGVLGGRERALDQMLREIPEGPILPDVRERLNDPVINVAGPAVSFFVLGIVLIMVIKPSLPIALLSLALAAIIGIAVGYITQPARVVRRAGAPSRL
jgi:MFS family permease